MKTSESDPVVRTPFYELAGIRSHMAQEKALGNPHFQTMLEKTLNRTVTLKR